MAVQSGNDSGEISNINITPMVDIILVLLVIFMVTANFLQKESININLPRVGASDPNVAQSMQVAITKEGKLWLEGAETDAERMVGVLTSESRRRPNMRVTLSADEGLAYGTIAGVMGMIRKSGVSRIALSVKR